MDNKAPNTGPQGGQIDIHCIILLGLCLKFHDKSQNSEPSGLEFVEPRRPGDLKVRD